MWHAKVTVTDLAGTVHDLSPSSVGPGTVLSISLSNEKADMFTFSFEDYSGSVRSWLEEGCTVDIFVGTSADPDTRILHGMVEEIRERMAGPNATLVEVSGRDLFWICLERRVTETYLNEDVSGIVRDLCNRYIPYPSDTVLAMSFYEGSGATAHDESQYGNDGTIYGASWTASGKYGYALSFDGNDDRVQFDAISESSLTFSCWLKLTEKASSHGHSLSISSQLYLHSANDYIYIDGTNDYFPVSLSEGVWHHLAFTYSNSSDDSTAVLYIDGTKYDIVQQAGNHSIQSLSMVGNTSNSFYGVIDEVRVWNRALSESEVKSLYAYQYLHDIDTTGIVADDVRFPYRRLSECLEDLANVSGFCFRGTPNNVIVFKERESVSSGISYDPSDLVPGAVKETSILPVRNRVYVIGGETMQEDQKDEDPSNPSYSNSYYWARPFTPTRSSIDQVSLYLGKEGSPADLTGAIYKDSSGKPGEKVATFTVDADFVQSSGAWTPISVKATVLIGETYWIGIDKIGDSSNRYIWYNSGVADDTLAYSTDGSAWTSSSPDVAFAFRTYYAVPIIARKQDYTSGGDYLWREEVHNDPAITSRAVANKMAQAILDKMNDTTPAISNLTTYNQTAIPNRGELVEVEIPQFNLDGEYVCQSVSFEFKGGEAGTPFMTVELGKGRDELQSWLAGIKKDIDRMKIGDIGVSGGIVDKLEYVGPESVTASSDATCNLISSGGYMIDSAEVDFSDVA